MSATNRCHGCAFTPGPEANTSPLTLIKATLAAKLAEPFYCHANLVDGKIPEGQAILCAGWADMVGSLNDRGYYRGEPDTKHAFLMALFQAVLTLEERALAGEDLSDFSVVGFVVQTLRNDPAWRDSGLTEDAETILTEALLGGPT